MSLQDLYNVVQMRDSSVNAASQQLLLKVSELNSAENMFHMALVSQQNAIASGNQQSIQSSAQQVLTTAGNLSGARNAFNTAVIALESARRQLEVARQAYEQALTEALS